MKIQQFNIRIYILYMYRLCMIYDQQTDYFINSTLRLNDKTTFIIL